MELQECETCGEEYPGNWGGCPFCDSGEKPYIKFDKDDGWN